MITEEQRLLYASNGWPPPIDRERCAAVTLKGKRCGRRRAQGSPICQQHERRDEARAVFEKIKGARKR